MPVILLSDGNPSNRSCPFMAPSADQRTHTCHNVELRALSLCQSLRVRNILTQPLCLPTQVVHCGLLQLQLLDSCLVVRVCTETCQA